MNLQVSDVAAYLRCRHVRVLDEWTVECLEWLKQEYQSQNVKPDEMKQYVYEQWLDSDLSDIAAPVLPQTISQQKKTSLAGNYALQVNSVQNVSVPAYGQLVKLQGKENENVLVCATQPTQPTQNKFDPKSSRMLMLQLTDGHQSLQGMEYQPIPSLSVDTPPGTKILVSGTVQCRLGILMLTANDIKVLGGDVESLADTNSQLQILSYALGVEGSQVSQQEPVQTASNRRDPVIQDTMDTIGSNDHLHSNTLRNTDNQGASRVNEAAFHEGGGFSDDLGDDLDALMLNEIQQIEEMDRIQQLASNAEEETDWPAEEEIDEMWLEQVEQTHAQGSSLPGVSTPADTKVSQPHALPSSSSHKDNGKVMVKTAQSTAGHSGIGLPYQPMPIKMDIVGRQVQAGEPIGRTGSRLQNVKPGISLSSSKSIGNVVRMNHELMFDRLPREPGFSETNSEFDLSKQSKCGDSLPIPSNTTKYIASVNAGKKSGQHSNTNVSPSPFERRTDSHGHDLKVHKGQSSSVTCISKETKSTLPESKELKDAQKMNPSYRPTTHGDSTKSSSIFQKLGSAKPVPAMGIAARITKEPSLNSAKNAPSSSSVATISSVEAQSRTLSLEVTGLNAVESISAAKRRRFYSSEGVAMESFAIVALSSVMTRIQAREMFMFNIKGFVVTLLSPLSRKDGYWSIFAKISDKTASLDVDLSNEVLTLLIGFSVPEMMRMKKSLKSLEATQAKELETKLRNGLAQCQKSLIDMYCSMTIKVSSNRQRPLVTTIGTTDPGDIATNFREVPSKT